MILPDDMTIGQSYDPAMVITDQAVADEYFEALVERNMRLTGNSRDEAERIERINLGYYAGYCSTETRERVNRLFAAKHPIFGDMTPEQAFEAGKQRAADDVGYVTITAAKAQAILNRIIEPFLNSEGVFDEDIDIEGSDFVGLVSNELIEEGITHEIRIVG